MPGIFTSRGLSIRMAVVRSTWTITMTPEFLAACAIDSVSRVTASCSIVMLPAGSAVVPRRNATSIRRCGKKITPGLRVRRAKQRYLAQAGLRPPGSIAVVIIDPV